MPHRLKATTDVQPTEASTDAVPMNDPASAPVAEGASLAQQPAPESLDSSGDQPADE